MTRMPDAVESEVVAGPGVEGARRATGGPGPRPGPGSAGDGPTAAFLGRVSAPHPQGRRRVQETRRGGRPVASRGVVFVAPDELAATARGGRPAGDARVTQLEAENRRLQQKLQRAETIITLQKKVAEILGIPLTPLDDDETD